MQTLKRCHDSAGVWPLSAPKRRLAIKELVTIFMTFSSIAPIAIAQTLSDAIPQSHIEANVPPEDQHNAFLQRDLLAYFKLELLPDTTSVEYQLLRAAPTQSGVSYPKYYLWARALEGSKLLEEGAVRVEAIGRTHFEVTTFISATKIRERHSLVNAVFPSLLVPVVLAKAGSK